MRSPAKYSRSCSAAASQHRLAPLDGRRGRVVAGEVQPGEGAVAGDERELADRGVDAHVGHGVLQRWWAA